MFFPFLTPKNPCLPVFILWLVGMVQGNLRLVSIPWTERAAAEDPGARPLPAQGQAVLASLPQVKAFARLLQGVRADLRDANLSLQDCKQWGNGDQSFSQPKVAGQEGKERTS